MRCLMELYRKLEPICNSDCWWGNIWSGIFVMCLYIKAPQGLHHKKMQNQNQKKGRCNLQPHPPLGQQWKNTISQFQRPSTFNSILNYWSVIHRIYWKLGNKIVWLYFQHAGQVLLRFKTLVPTTYVQKNCTKLFPQKMHLKLTS